MAAVVVATVAVSVPEVISLVAEIFVIVRVLIAFSFVR